MFATFLVVGMACWLAMFSSAEAALADQTDAPPLFDNLGSLHHPITTTSEQAQRYFDQGLRLVYAFNHEEAIRSFEAATQQDPQAAMPYWGIALALGPNINSAMEKKDEHRAIEMVQKRLDDWQTTQLVGSKAYIEALVLRYVSRKGANRKGLNEAYAKAMRSVAQRFPEDDDAATLFAEALMDLRPWDFWKPDGRPQPGTEEIVTTLESVLARNPDHPGACHYYLHAVEASSQPERALPCAERLPVSCRAPAISFICPPIFTCGSGSTTKRWSGISRQPTSMSNTSASQHPTGEYADGYYKHNLHFLWASLAMEGRNVEAMKAARDLTATITAEEARKDRWKELYLPTPIFSMIRFGRWEELLRESPPPKGLRLMEGMWRLGRGLALVSTGRLPGLRVNTSSLPASQSRSVGIARRRKRPNGRFSRLLSGSCQERSLSDASATMTRFGCLRTRSKWKRRFHTRSRHSGHCPCGTIWGQRSCWPIARPKRKRPIMRTFCDIRTTGGR